MSRVNRYIPISQCLSAYPYIFYEFYIKSCHSNMIYFMTSTPTYCFVLVLHAVFIFHSANYFPCSRLKKCSYVFLQELCVLGFAEKCCMICLLEYMLLRQTSGLGQRGLEMMPVHTYLTITRLITEGEVKDLKHLSQQVNRKNASFALQM